MPLNVHNTSAARLVFEDPNSFATTMTVLLADFYGMRVFSWAPETIRLEVSDDIGVTWSQTNYDRLMAGVALITSNSFYKSLSDFIELCNILSGAAASPGVFSPADPAECAWGITEALLLSPPDDEEAFNEEIRSYIGEVCEMEGIITPPDILRIGIMREGLKIRVHNDFSDDPDMYAAIWETEASKTEDINDLVKARLTLLIQQLAVLKLVNGNAGGIAKRMLKSLNAAPTGGGPLK